MRPKQTKVQTGKIFSSGYFSFLSQLYESTEGFQIIRTNLWLPSHSCPTSTHGASGACGFGPYQLSTPVQGEKVGDNPGTDLPHLYASQKPEQTK